MASPQKEHGYTGIANELYEVIILTPLPGRHKDIWHFVLRKTYGYGKKSDYISLSQFVNGTGIDRRSTTRIIKELVAWKLLDKEGSRYAVHKDYQDWLVAQRPLGRGVEAPKVGAHTPHTKENIQKKDTAASPQTLKMKKNRMGSYSEDRASDSHEEVVDLETGEVKKEVRVSKMPRYKELLAWSEQQRGKKWMPHTITKQFKAFSLAHKYGINDSQLKTKWMKMKEDRFWGEAGFDWMNVIDQFNKKPNEKM